MPAPAGRFSGHPYITVDYLGHLAGFSVLREHKLGTGRTIADLLIKAGLAEWSDRSRGGGELFILGGLPAPRTGADLLDWVKAANAAVRLKGDGGNNAFVALSDPYQDPSQGNCWMVRARQEESVMGDILIRISERMSKYIGVGVRFHPNEAP